MKKFQITDRFHGREILPISEDKNLRQCKDGEFMHRSLDN